MAKDLRISVITTKRDYEELKKEGFITSIVGKGSFVAGQNHDLLKEKRLNLMEEHLSEIVEESKQLRIDLDELKEILEML